MVVDNFECILEGDKFLTQEIHGVLLICVDDTKETVSAVVLCFPKVRKYQVIRYYYIIRIGVIVIFLFMKQQFQSIDFSYLQS